MGYTTEFEGQFNFNKKVSESMKNFINGFTNTRHMLYDTEAIKNDFEFYKVFTLDGDLGENGCFINDAKRILENNEKRYVIDYNRSGKCPSLWAQWIITDDNSALIWDGSEKFYEYTNWLVFYIENFFKKNGYILNGVCYYYGEDSSDAGYLIIDNNEVFQYNFLNIRFDDLIKKHSKNIELVNQLKADKLNKKF